MRFFAGAIVVVLLGCGDDSQRPHTSLDATVGDTGIEDGAPAAFGAPIYVDVNPYAAPVYPVVQDFNGDGKVDVAFLSHVLFGLTVLLNTTPPGATTVTFETTELSAGIDPYGSAVGDFNGDGKPDLVLGNASNSTVAVYLNTTSTGALTAAFTARTEFAAGEVSSVAVFDVNADGKPDIVGGAYGNPPNTAGGVSVLLNTTTTNAATPSFSAAVNFTAMDLYVTDVAVADVDSDGKTDVVVVNPNANAVTVFRNTTTAGAATPSLASAQSFSACTGPGHLATRDFDLDGKTDLFVPCASPPSVAPLWNTGSPGTVSFVALDKRPVGYAPTGMAFLDVDRFPFPDLAFVQSTTDVCEILVGPAFWYVASFKLDTSAQGVVVGDFNRDHHSDLLVYGPVSPLAFVLAR